MSERTEGGLFLVDAETRAQLMQPPKRPPMPHGPSVPSFSTGRRINVTLLSEYFVTDPGSWQVDLDDPALLLTTAPITSYTQLVPVLEECMRAAQPIAIGAPAIDVDTVTFLVANKLRGTLYCAAFQREADAIDNIAKFAGAAGALTLPESARLAELPRVSKVVLTPNALSIRPY